MKTLYLECRSGISGDMTVAALLDLGADWDALQRVLGSLHLEGFRASLSRVEKNGISAADFSVELTDPEVFPHEHTHLVDGRLVTHTHAHEHGHEEGHGERGLSEILPIIASSGLSERGKKLASDIFVLLAKAEAQVHGTDPEHVHFHEVGAADSIVDVVSAAFCVDDLDVGRVIVSPLREGTGTVLCRHGLMPVPAPATLKILEAAGIPLELTDVQGEMVTPTGAAIAAALADSFRLPDRFTVERVGVGAGKKDFPQANVLRAMLVREAGREEDEICVLQTCIDDSTPEQLAYCRELLLEAGALDAYFTPVSMKKSRPGSELTVLCSWEDRERLTSLIFRETTTIGLRYFGARRSVMARRGETAETEFGPVELKVCSWEGMEKRYVEYESAAAAARKSGRPLDEIYRKALRNQD